MLEPQLIAETAEELILLKPPGMPTQADPTGDLDLLTWAEGHWGMSLYLVHRIDRPVGGVVLFAKSKRSAARWSERFRKGQVQKAYLAITSPPVYPPFGELRHYLKKDVRRHRAQVFYRPQPQAQLAVLKYQILAAQGDKGLILVEPQTGRFHQIRAQLAEVRSPIVGDVKYGYPAPAPDPRRIALWAWRLERWLASPPLSVEPWRAFKSEIENLVSASSK
ncbi:MAG: RNA pseudouridine synthase [Bacteroidia bacterium]|nr:RNA pseudouridine synthase [Bacteroidia bacterium]